MLSAFRKFEEVWWLRNRGHTWGALGDEAREKAGAVIQDEASVSG